MSNGQYRDALKTLLKSLTDYYGAAVFPDTAHVSRLAELVDFNGLLCSPTSTNNAGGDNHTDSNDNSHFPLNLPHSMLAELFLLFRRSGLNSTRLKGYR